MGSPPTLARPNPTSRPEPSGPPSSCWSTCRRGLGGHEFGDWPPTRSQGFGGDLPPATTPHPRDPPHPPPTVRERAFDRLNPHFGIPADQRSLYGRTIREREAALALGVPWPSTTAARTTPTPSSGSPARTTAWPTPSTAARHQPTRNR